MAWNVNRYWLLLLLSLSLLLLYSLLLLLLLLVSAQKMTRYGVSEFFSRITDKL